MGTGGDEPRETLGLSEVDGERDGGKEVLSDPHEDPKEEKDGEDKVKANSAGKATERILQPGLNTIKASPPDHSIAGASAFTPIMSSAPAPSETTATKACNPTVPASAAPPHPTPHGSPIVEDSSTEFAHPMMAGFVITPLFAVLQRVSIGGRVYKVEEHLAEGNCLVSVFLRGVNILTDGEAYSAKPDREMCRAWRRELARKWEDGEFNAGEVHEEGGALGFLKEGLIRQLRAIDRHTATGSEIFMDGNLDVGELGNIISLYAGVQLQVYAWDEGRGAFRRHKFRHLDLGTDSPTLSILHDGQHHFKAVNTSADEGEGDEWRVHQFDPSRISNSGTGESQSARQMGDLDPKRVDEVDLSPVLKASFKTGGTRNNSGVADRATSPRLNNLPLVPAVSSSIESFSRPAFEPPFGSVVLRLRSSPETFKAGATAPTKCGNLGGISGSVPQSALTPPTRASAADPVRKKRRVHIFDLRAPFRHGWELVQGGRDTDKEYTRVLKSENWKKLMEVRRRDWLHPTQLGPIGFAYLRKVVRDNPGLHARFERFTLDVGQLEGYSIHAPTDVAGRRCVARHLGECRSIASMTSWMYRIALVEMDELYEYLDFSDVHHEMRNAIQAISVDMELYDRLRLERGAIQARSIAAEAPRLAPPANLTLRPALNIRNVLEALANFERNDGFRDPHCDYRLDQARGIPLGRGTASLSAYGSPADLNPRLLDGLMSGFGGGRSITGSDTAGAGGQTDSVRQSGTRAGSAMNRRERSSGRRSSSKGTNAMKTQITGPGEDGNELDEGDDMTRNDAGREEGRASAPVKTQLESRKLK